MATHDYVIDNQTSASARADINNVLQAILTNNSSSTAPTVTNANMFWYDTANNVLKMRNEADTDWIIVGYLNQTTNQMEVRTDVIQAASGSGTSVKNSSGTTIIDLSVATQATAEAATNNTQLMTPLRVKQSIVANTPEGGWEYITKYEPTSDVTSFDINIGTDYKVIRADFGAEFYTADYMRIRGGTSSSTTRAIYQRYVTSGQYNIGSVTITNWNNHISGVPKTATGCSSEMSGDIDRSNGGISVAQDAEVQAGYSSYSEVWSVLRFEGRFIGTNSNRRAWVYVTGMK
jgi:hypothetical protein